MSDVESLIQLLRSILEAAPLDRPALIRQFQETVWNNSDLDVPAAALDVLGELAYDLDFFEPNQAVRKEAKSYYGEDRLEGEIRQALEKLRLQGVAAAE